MTDNEKLKKFETLEVLSRTAGGWFGCDDLIFAGHQFDEDRAKDARKLASDNNISLKEMEDMAISFLVRRNCGKEHFDKQMSSVSKFFSKKLS